MRIIDAHVYLGQGCDLQQTPDELLRRMDEAGIERAVVCPVDRYIAVANREGNDLVAAAVNGHPDRLLGMAVANPWFRQSAADELKRAVDCGLRGWFMHPVYQGAAPLNPVWRPLLELATACGIPVYVHSGTAGIAEPLHVAELARRFPAVNFIMGHAGASDYGLDAVTALEFADNLWLETSRNGPANFGLWKARHSLSRVVFGSSSPEYVPAVEIETIKEILPGGEQQALVFNGNIRNVFKERGPG